MCNQVAKRLDDDEVRLEGGRALAVNRGGDKVNHLLRGTALLIEECVRKYILYA